MQQQALRDFATGNGRVLRPKERGRATVVAQGRPRPGVPGVALKPGALCVGLAGKTGEVWIPKAGWVRFRWSRAVPAGVKSYRVTIDRAGRWHVAFAAIPAPIPAPGNGKVAGIDRGVAVGAALSTGELLRVPGLTAQERHRLLRLERKRARAKRGSNRRRESTACHRPTEAPVRRTGGRTGRRRPARTSRGSFDVIRVEDLQIRNMTRSARGTRENPGRNVRQKTGLNRGILRSGWGLLVRRLEEKAPGRVEKIKTRVHEPALLGLRASAREVAREPSRLPVHCLRIRLPCRRERGPEYRGGARRDCAGRQPGCRAWEPRTSTACLLNRT